MRKSSGDGATLVQSKPFAVAIVLEFDLDATSDYKWTGRCPTMPACFSEGRSRREVVRNIRELLAAYLDLVGKELADKDVEIVQIKA